MKGQVLMSDEKDSNDASQQQSHDRDTPKKT